MRCETIVEHCDSPAWYIAIHYEYDKPKIKAVQFLCAWHAGVLFSDTLRTKRTLYLALIDRIKCVNT